MIRGGSGSDKRRAGHAQTAKKRRRQRIGKSCGEDRLPGHYVREFKKKRPGLTSQKKHQEEKKYEKDSESRKLLRLNPKGGLHPRGRGH